MRNVQSQFAKKLLADVPTSPKSVASAFAPANVALCKYWGKRDAALNLPVNSSLSVSLGELGTRTEIRRIEAEGEGDRIWLDGRLRAPGTSFARRVSSFLDLFRSAFGEEAAFEVRTQNDVPTAAGLASSASGFAALTLALNELAGWGLDRKRLSMLARLGSGSAARSLWQGFVRWHAGTEADGTDSFAERLDAEWPALRVGIVELTAARKPVGSREGMARTVETSRLYERWPKQAEEDLRTLRAAVEARDFSGLGRAAERNALAMHATMFSAWPPLIYWLPETIEALRTVQALRAEGTEAYVTIDAGPNVKVLFLEECASAVRSAFPSLRIVRPFGSSDAKSLPERIDFRAENP